MLADVIKSMNIILEDAHELGKVNNTTVALKPHQLLHIVVQFRKGTVKVDDVNEMRSAIPSGSKIHFHVFARLHWFSGDKNLGNGLFVWAKGASFILANDNLRKMKNNDYKGYYNCLL